jgi:predicted kinase
MSQQTLYLMVGYPGSGKTTVSKIIHDLTGAEHLWADHERTLMFARPTHNHQENITLYATLNTRTRNLLRNGKSVIFDTNFNFYKDRKKLRVIAAKEGVNTLVIWVQTPKNIARERATELSHGQETRLWGNMPVEHFDRIANNLQEPLPEEHAIVINGMHVDTSDVIAALGL